MIRIVRKSTLDNYKHQEELKRRYAKRCSEYYASLTLKKHDLFLKEKENEILKSSLESAENALHEKDRELESRAETIDLFKEMNQNLRKDNENKEKVLDDIKKYIEALEE